MKHQYRYLNTDAAAQLMESALGHLADRPLRSAVAFRNAVRDGAFGINPMIQANISLADEAHRKLCAVIDDGCMIDFGFVPNEMIKTVSGATREVFESGELLHPFQNWLGVMAWEGGCNGYFVNQSPVDGADHLLVTEYYGVDAPGIGPTVLFFDAVKIRVGGVGNTLLEPMPVIPYAGDTLATRKARASNSLDPLVTMLRMLADASVPVERVEPPGKLNRARAKSGKLPIPAHTVVRTEDYVTHFTAHKARQGRGEAKGGSHASPIAHWRRAHQRHLPDRVVNVRPAKVNWRDASDLHRMFYQVKINA